MIEPTMLSGLENPVHLLIIAVVVLLVFGPKRLPELGRSLGSGIRGFRDSISGGDGEPAEPASPEVPAAPADVKPKPSA
jgi:sec-independent protein translocase protein TatA